MLHLIGKLLPIPLYRVGLRLAHAVRLVWWRIRRPLLVGCQVIAINPEGQVLLVRHSYGQRLWMLPGGGVSRHEAPMAAAIRELREETACHLTDPAEVAILHRQWHGAPGIQHIIAGHTHDTPHADGREIVEAQWFAPHALAPDTSPRVAKYLADWLAEFERKSAKPK